MRFDTFNRRFGSVVRRGMAPLEFVMALPVLLLLMVSITWLGFSVIGQTEVLVEARNLAWKRRFENLSDKPLIFPMKVSLPLIPAYSEDSDFATETVSKKVDVSPIFSMVPGPSASHTVMAGSWDWRALPLSDPPNFDEMKTMAITGKAGQFADRLRDLDGDAIAEALRTAAEKKLEEVVDKAVEDHPEAKIALEAAKTAYREGANWEAIGKEVVKQILLDAAKKNKAVEMILDAAGMIDDGGGAPKSSAENNPNADSAKQKQQGDRESRRAAELAKVEADITATKEELAKLNPPQNNQQPQPDPNQQTQEEKDKQKAEEERKKQLTEYLQDKLKRLESQKADINAGPDLNDPNNEQ